jgi:hypothetical protein
VCCLHDFQKFVIGKRLIREKALGPEIQTRLIIL